MHRKKKIIVLIIVFLGIVVIAIFLKFSASDQSSASSGNVRTGDSGSCTVAGHGISFMLYTDNTVSFSTEVQNALEQDPIHLSGDDLTKILQGARKQYTKMRKRDDSSMDMNWKQFTLEMQKSCTEVTDLQDFCTFAESMIKGCAAYAPCKDKMESVKDLLEDLMCDECEIALSYVCKDPQWPYDTVTTDDGDGAQNNGDFSSCGSIQGEGKYMWTEVQKALKKTPISLDEEQRKELVFRRAREQYNIIKRKSELPMLNWKGFKERMLKLSCTEVVSQDLCIFSESIIRACETYGLCKNKMAEVTDMLGSVMCNECIRNPSAVCLQWPYATVITDEGAGAKGTSEEQYWVVEKSNGRYLVRFWREMEDRLPLSDLEVANWKSKTYTYHSTEYWDTNGMVYYFGFLSSKPCLAKDFGDRTFVGKEDILCSVANAILWECHAIPECKSQLPFVREELMNPDKPGKWCGFGWDKALENLNFCSKEEYPILDSGWIP